MKFKKGLTQVQLFVHEKMMDEQVKKDFMALNDLLREAAEEESFSLKVRKRMVHQTIRELMRTYW